MRRRPPGARRWTVAQRLAAILAVLTVVGLVAGCGAGSVAPPPEDAARVVPADALAYVSLSLERSDSSVAQLRSTVAGLPGYRGLIAGLKARLASITGTRFATQIAPWLGSEIAVAIVPEGDSASELIVLGVANRVRARAFVAAVGGGVDARLVDGDVVLGERAAVDAAGRGPALAASAAFRQTQAAAPAGRVLDAYGTGAGLAELLGDRAGLANVGEAVLSAEAPRAVAAALTPTGDGLRVWVDLVDPAPSTTHFSPTLAAHLPADTAWVAQMPSLTGSAPGLLQILAAASSFGSSASSVAELAQKLGPALSAEGISASALGALFNRPSAIFDLDRSVGVMTETTDISRARLVLGNAGQALAELFAASGGASATSVPLVATQSVHGVEVTEYQEGTSSQLDLAVFKGVMAITTSQAAMDAIIDEKSSLASSSAYQSVLHGLGPSAGPVLFGAINRLVRPGDQTGLLQSLGLEGADRMLAQITAAGLSSTSERTHTTAELFFTIS